MVPLGANNPRSCDNGGAKENGPGGATNTVTQGLTASKERLIMHSTHDAPGDGSQMDAASFLATRGYRDTLIWAMLSLAIDLGAMRATDPAALPMISLDDPARELAMRLSQQLDAWEERAASAEGDQ